MAKRARLEVKRPTLAAMLTKHGETELADRIAAISDEQLVRIQTLGAYYAFSDDALVLHGSMGGTRALSLAAIDVLEGTGRDLVRHHTEVELGWGWSEEPDAAERARDHELRRHAAEMQTPEPD